MKKEKAFLRALIAGFCALPLIFGAVSCSSDTDDDDTPTPKSEEKSEVQDSGVITVTAPETAGTVKLVADSDASTALYAGTSVQEALEYLMTNNSTGSYTISVASGTYEEMLFYTGSASITIEGTGTAQYGTDVLITYSNSDNSKAMEELAKSHGVTGGYTRGATRFDGKCNLVLKNVTIQNSYSRSANDGSGTQAEALVFSSTGNLIAYNSCFLSHQDTLYLGNKGGRMWFYKDYIAGDVDFIWGYMDVALFEECSIYCRGDEATKAYIFASRSMDTDAVNKGIVVYNCDIEVADGVTMWYGRNSGSDTTAAILNNTITGLGTLNANLYQSAPLSYVEDVAGDLALGYKDYNNTMNGTLVDTSSRLTRTGALSERVAKREYNGRYAILNRGYNTTDEQYETASTIWDISAYEEEFGATEDTSNTNIYVDPVYAKNVVGGNTVQLTPSSDTEGLTYNYASSDESLATVDANGLVTTVAGADGVAVITVTGSNGSTDTMSVKVIAEDIPATAVNVTLADTSVAKYGVTTATITFEPADTSDQTFTLTSADSNVLLYDTANSKLASSTTVEASDGTATVSVWVGGDVTDATLTAKSTAYESATAGTATVSTTEGAVTWGDTCAWRIGTDIQKGSYGIYDGLVIDSTKTNSALITDTSNTGKMSLKTNSSMQTRNVILYIPVEGASAVAINLASGSTGCKYYVGESESTTFTANDDNTVWTYEYDGSTTGIVLGSAISGLGTLGKQAGDDIAANGKYLRVVIARTASDVYISSINVTKTGEFTATWDTTTQTGAEGTYSFGSSDYLSDTTTNNDSVTGAYASSDGFVTGTDITADGKGHGYAVAADSTVTIHVAGITQIDVLGCAYGNGAPFTATVGSETLATVSSCNASTDGGVGATFYYTTDAEADIVITFSGAGWVHGIKVTPLDSWTAVESISVTDSASGTSSTIELGDTVTLTATVSPSTATVADVIWSTGDSSVATVTDGVVTGMGSGNTVITATSSYDSTIYGTYSVEVQGSFSANAATVSWDLSASTVNIQKILGNLKGTVTGSTDYTVRAIVDATVSSGKLQGNGSQHAQMNSGTVISVPVTAGAVVSVTASSAGAQYALYTIAGEAASTSELTSTYTATAAAWVAIVATGTAYPASIEITNLDLENLPDAISESYGWNEQAIVDDSVKIQSTTGYYDGLYVDATSGKFAANNTSWTQCNTGTVIYVPMNGAGTVSFTTYGAYTITGGESTDLTTTASAAVSYTVSASDLVSSGVDGDDTQYAKITFTSGGYIKNLARVYSE